MVSVPNLSGPFVALKTSRACVYLQPVKKTEAARVVGEEGEAEHTRNTFGEPNEKRGVKIH